MALLLYLDHGCYEWPEAAVEEEGHERLAEGVGQDVSQATAQLAQDVVQDAVGGAQQDSYQEVADNAHCGADFFDAAFRVPFPPTGGGGKDIKGHNCGH